MPEKNDLSLKPIKTKQGVIDFFNYLFLDRKVNFHPDDDFSDYENQETGARAFTPEEAKAINARMKEAFSVAGKHIYDIANDLFEKHFPELKKHAEGGDLLAKPKLQFESGGGMGGTKFSTGGKAKGSLCPVGTEIQTLIFKKAAFKKAAAVKWVRSHGFPGHEVDETQQSYRIRQQDPQKFNKESFRTISLTKGLKAVIGCPVKK